MLSFGILIGCIVICEAVGFISGLATRTSVKTWYRKLKKPPFNPPASLFGPAWIILYALMGIALFLVLQSPEYNIPAILFFSLQLALNFLWSFIFFYWHKIGWALVEILLLLVSIVITIMLFYPISMVAVFLFIPYLCWVSFAAILNGALWYLNR